MKKRESGISGPWAIFNYEVFMLLHSTFLSYDFEKKTKNIDIALNNALLESRFLHLRTLMDILLSRHKNFEDDINIGHIIDRKYYTEYLSTLLHQLKEIYGTNSKKLSPCWILNRLLTHPSKFREAFYNYSELFIQLFPIIYNILKEIQLISQNDELKEHLEFAHNIQ